MSSKIKTHMKLYYFTFLILLVCNNIFSQKFRRDIICTTDTLVLKVDTTFINSFEELKLDSIISVEYKVVLCRQCSHFGYRIEAGVSKYYYGENTYSWIGNHGGPHFGLTLSLYNINFGARFKPWTANPQKELLINGQYVPPEAKLNPIKMDYFVGYSFNMNKLWSIEPYLGYNSSSFEVINEEELNQSFEFNKTGGFICGMSVHKYFKIKDSEFLSLFGTLGCGFVDYVRIHPELDNNYFEWAIGIAYKGFAIKRFFSRVE